MFNMFGSKSNNNGSANGNSNGKKGKKGGKRHERSSTDSNSATTPEGAPSTSSQNEDSGSTNSLNDLSPNNLVNIVNEIANASENISGQEELTQIVSDILNDSKDNEVQSSADDSQLESSSSTVETAQEPEVEQQSNTVEGVLKEDVKATETQVESNETNTQVSDSSLVVEATPVPTETVEVSVLLATGEEILGQAEEQKSTPAIEELLTVVIQAQELVKESTEGASFSDETKSEEQQATNVEPSVEPSHETSETYEDVPAATIDEKQALSEEVESQSVEIETQVISVSKSAEDKAKDFQAEETQETTSVDQSPIEEEQSSPAQTGESSAHEVELLLVKETDDVEEPTAEVETLVESEITAPKAESQVTEASAEEIHLEEFQEEEQQAVVEHETPSEEIKASTPVEEAFNTEKVTEETEAADRVASEEIKIAEQFEINEVCSALCVELKEQIDTKFNELKEKYIQEFDLSDTQFDLVSQFFDQNKTGSNLSNKFIRLLMIESLKEREVVKATQDDIQRALEALDKDNDECVNLDEFFQLLVLFFASKLNLKTRLISVLYNQSVNHENKGSLTASEANDFVVFLNQFYSRQLGKDEEISTFEDGTTYNQIAGQLSQDFSSFAYVQWQHHQQ